MNGYNDIIAETSDDEDMAIAMAAAYGFEVISEEELLYSMLSSTDRSNPTSFSSSRRRGNGKVASNNKNTSPFSSVFLSGAGAASKMKKPIMSSCSLSSHGSEMSEAEDSSSSESGGISESDDVEGHQLSVEDIWYHMQQKRHLHQQMEEEMRMARSHLLTMELASNSHHHNRVAEWFSSLRHFPDKMRKLSADKHRFNIDKVPKEIREELKHIYVY